MESNKISLPRIISHQEALLLSEGWNLVSYRAPRKECELLIYIVENGKEMQVLGEYTEFGWVIHGHDTYDVIAWKEPSRGDKQ